VNPTANACFCGQTDYVEIRPDLIECRACGLFWIAVSGAWVMDSKHPEQVVAEINAGRDSVVERRILVPKPADFVEFTFEVPKS
jgi:hypothetical protein